MQKFPLSQSYLHIPEISNTEFNYIINNYKNNGNLFTVRYIPLSNYNFEILYLDPNDDNLLWLLVVNFETKIVDYVRKIINIDFDIDNMQNYN